MSCPLPKFLAPPLLKMLSFKMTVFLCSLDLPGGIGNNEYKTSHGVHQEPLTSLVLGLLSILLQIFQLSSTSPERLLGKLVMPFVLHIWNSHFCFTRRVLFLKHAVAMVLLFGIYHIGCAGFLFTLSKLPDHRIFPGYTCLQTRKSEGRSFPQGAIVGAVPFFQSDELQGLAAMMDAGCSKMLSSWEVPLTSSG